MKVFAPTAFRYPANTGTDYPYGLQDIPNDSLARTLLDAGLVVADDPGDQTDANKRPLSALTAAQASAVVKAVSDTRAIAAWYAKLASGTAPTICHWGDSTTEQMHGAGVLLYSGAWYTALAPVLARAGVTMLNRGNTGQTLAGAMGAGPQNNAGSVDCSVSGVAALKADLYVICFGINDCRTDATIIGSYGNAGQVAKARALQALFVSAAATIRAQTPAASIVWRMPNAHITGSAYFLNSVTAQHCMDTYRLTFRGDSALGVPSLASLVAGSVMYDTLGAWFSDTMYAASPTHNRINGDGLHPQNSWYQDFIADLGRLLSGPATAALVGADAVARAAATLVSRPALPYRPANPADSDDYVQIGVMTASLINASFFDASFMPDGLAGSLNGGTAGWGAAAAAGYASASLPALHVHDVVVWYPAGKPSFVMPIGRMADSRPSNDIRWFSGGPDGYYPSAAQLAAGDVGIVYRRKDFGSPDFRVWQARQGGGGGGAYPANAYGFSATSPGNGSLSIAWMPPFGEKATKYPLGKAVAQTDRLILAGVTPADGLLLTGATWAGSGSGTTGGTITLAGVDFSKLQHWQGVLLSAT